MLAGCSADAEPKALPPVQSISPTAVVLALPPEATPASAQGAASFTRFYFELLNQAFSTGDATQVRDFSDPACDACNNLIGAIEEEPKPGERIEGGDYRILFAESPPAEGGDVVVELRYALAGARVLGPDGMVIRSTPPNPGIDAQLRLVRRGSTWVVRGFRNVKP